jgi:hypothetical protein
MRTGAGRDGLARGCLDDVLIMGSIIRTLSIMAVRYLFSLLGPLGTVICVHKNTFGYIQYIYIYSSPFRASGRAGRDGCVWMNLDDVSVLGTLVIDKSQLFSRFHGYGSHIVGKYKVLSPRKD